MYSEKLSIIIPTRNRQLYAEKCVETLLLNLCGKYEIIVQDNSDNDSLCHIIKSLDNNNVIYNYSPDCLSFCANFETALDLATGDYIMFIGDDDSVLSCIMDVVNFARKYNYEAIRYTDYISYLWPKAKKNNETGTLVIRDLIPKIQCIDTKDALIKMISKGNFAYQNYNFPFIYNGVIRHEAIDRAKAKTGNFFGGLTPDIYAAVSLSFHIREILYVNFPLAIPGVCPKSGTDDGLTGKHNGELSNAPHFRGTKNYQWDNRIPPVYSVDTIWAETALKAVEDNGGVIEFSRKMFYHYTVILCSNNPSAMGTYVDFYRTRYNDNLLIHVRIKISVLLYKMRRFFVRGGLYIKRVVGGRHVFKNVDTINSAVTIVNAHFEKNKSVCALKNKMAEFERRLVKNNERYI